MGERFEDALEVVPAIRRLRALMGSELRGVAAPVRRALQEDDYSAALSAANDRYSKRGAGDTEAAITYAALLAGRQLVAEAQGVVRRAETEAQQDGRLALLKADLALEAGDDDSAIGMLKALEGRDDLTARHREFVAELYLELGRDDEAVRWYEGALDAGLESRQAAWRVAHMYNERGDDEQAAIYLAAAARFDGNDAQLAEAAAEACWEVGLIEEATRCYEQLVELRPYHTQGWFTLGLCYWFDDRFEEGAEAFEKVVQLNPNHREAYIQLGQLWLTVGHGERALEAFRRALKLDPENPRNLAGAAMAAYQTGDLQAAGDWAQQALQLDPEHRQARLTFAVVSLARGDYQEALALLKPLADADDSPGADVLGPLAVAELKTGERRAGFEHIDELARLHQGQQWLARFTLELVRECGVDEALEFINGSESTDPQWQLVRPMLGYFCSALVDDEQRAEQFLHQLLRQVEQHPEATGVMWDFEPWEALSLRLDRQSTQVFEMMLSVVEGRSEPAQLRQQVSN